LFFKVNRIDDAEKPEHLEQYPDDKKELDMRRPSSLYHWHASRGFLGLFDKMISKHRRLPSRALVHAHNQFPLTGSIRKKAETTVSAWSFDLTA